MICDYDSIVLAVVAEKQLLSILLRVVGRHGVPPWVWAVLNIHKQLLGLER